MGHRPQKKWGQNFLRNHEAARRIVDALQPPPAGLIVEIGPGHGALTELLLELPNRVLAFEIDPELIERLRARFDDPARLTVLHTDATDASWPDEPFWAVGNLPYNVATPIVRRVVSTPGWRRAVFMFQKEVGDKLTAAPGDEEYGFLTIAVRLRASAKKLFTLQPGSFRPRPKVQSAVVTLEPSTPSLATSVDAVESLASAAFRMRRKKLVNNLIGFEEMTRPEAAGVIEAAGLREDVRAETLGIEEFDRLAAAIAARRASAPQRPE